MHPPPDGAGGARGKLEHGYGVFTHDEHFRSIDGLVTGVTAAAFLP